MAWLTRGGVSSQPAIAAWGRRPDDDAGARQASEVVGIAVCSLVDNPSRVWEDFTRYSGQPSPPGQQCVQARMPRWAGKRHGMAWTGSFQIPRVEQRTQRLAQPPVRRSAAVGDVGWGGCQGK